MKKGQVMDLPLCVAVCFAGARGYFSDASPLSFFGLSFLPSFPALASFEDFSDVPPF